MTKPSKYRTNAEILQAKRDRMRKARVQCVPLWENKAYTNQTLVDWLVDNHMEVAQLAEKAGISNVTVYKIMKGEGTTTHTVNCILKATGLQYEELFGDN
jgi:predicted transcriptional regulator